jgi:HlyD family secretion protein
MKRSVYILIAAVILLFTTVQLLRSRDHGVKTPATQSTLPREGLIAAPGRVEAVSEEIRVSSELSGRLKGVFAEEGERVRKGQILAQIENEDYLARVASAEAAVAERQAELLRIVKGARSQERRAAEASKQAAQAVLENSRREAERRRNLADREMISRDEAERYERAYLVARAEFERASEEFSLIDAEAREEDRLRAEAAVSVARAQLAEARAFLDKTYVRSPFDAIILRKFRHAGESVSTQFDSPIVTLADDSTLRVRLDVDETDVARLRVGQPAFVIAEAYGLQRFTGHVIRVGQILGKKNVRTEEPSERVDTKILETLIELDPGQKLPLGLRVDSFVEVSGPRSELAGPGPLTRP